MQVCRFEGDRPIGKPRDWVDDLDGECGVIYVADAVDTLSGHNFMYSVYKPTPEELAALNAGGALRLGIIGTSHPVFNLTVLGPHTCEVGGVRPVWDMGPVLGD